MPEKIKVALVGLGNCFSGLIQGIEYYSKNHTEAKKIAKKGWQRGHRDYNERIITNYFLDSAFNNKPTQDYSWPIHQFYK